MRVAPPYNSRRNAGYSSSSNGTMVDFTVFHGHASHAGNCALGVEREICTSSGVMSAGMLANNGVER